MVAETEGTPFGRYRLIELIGEGGMGEVWRAHDTVTDRVVAIKVLPAHLSKDEDFQQRFRREAHAAVRLETPHVVPIYDYGEIEGRRFVCMRLIEGRDLATVLADGPLEPARGPNLIKPDAGRDGLMLQHPNLTLRLISLRRHLPQATICYDPIHIMQWVCGRG
jgi:serine/threonine protein kinase